MKTNIQPLKARVLDRVMELDASTYEWKGRPDGKERIGFIAQEVEKVFPEVVTTAVDGTNKGLECTGLNAIAIVAIKEQQAEIATLSARNDELKARMESLERLLGRSAAKEAPKE